ncbi:MAG: ATP-binding protein [Candidatus Woesearchaeota archaeon]
MPKGQIVGGKFGELIIRQKAGESIEIGELLVSESNGSKIILQVYDISYGSQISQQNLELISGMVLEENTDMEFMNPQVRNYILVKAKNLVNIKNNESFVSKNLPEFFSNVNAINKEDITFFTDPENPLFLGKLRSGSHAIDLPVEVDGIKVLQHHILIAATTGRGKSNFVKNMLWHILNRNYAGILVLDPHDEYFGRNTIGLKDHPRKDKVVFYSRNPPPGGRTLKINVKAIKPLHFKGVLSLSEAQEEALYSYYKLYKEDWVTAVLSGSHVEGFQDSTLNVLKRKIQSILELKKTEEGFFSSGIFDVFTGQTIIKDIANDLENAKVVIIDTSSLQENAEILLGSLLACEIFNRYRYYNQSGVLKNKPVVSIVIEEAPRVLGKNVLEKGSNIFERIAREGRKFKIGLTAITQLPSLIPREILTNMNTKVILGIEMAPERQAIIDSAAQDLSKDDRAIASLDRGEAIVTSNFLKFAVPIKIPLFGADKEINRPIKSYQQEYLGVRLV